MGTSNTAPRVVDLKREDFQTTIDDRPVDLYTLRNAAGAFARITNYGAKIVQVVVPDRDGVFADVVQGYDSIARVRTGQKSMGSFIGRFANRIGHARFMLDGKEVLVAANAPPHHMHGGIKGTRFRVFNARQLDEQSLELTYVFADAEEGFPGTMPLRLVYTLSDDGALTIAYDTVTVDKATVINFTDHSFFNLSGDAATPILDHVLTVPSSRVLELGDGGVPTGNFRDVAGTPMDFRTPETFGARIEADDAQLRLGGGYDHFYILDKSGDGLALGARAVHPASGRVLEVWTTEPGVQVYTGNNLSGDAPRDIGKGGTAYRKYTGFCLEPSHYPDAPNHPGFQGITLQPGQWYSGRIVYAFKVEK